jgi:RHH-type rel operon transcriptional repressor/antitoxin RelB
MPESPMVGSRIPQEWQDQINAIAEVAGRKPSDVVREAIARYLGHTDSGAVRGAISKLEDRVAKLEQKLARFGETG